MSFKCFGNKFFLLFIIKLLNFLNSTLMDKTFYFSAFPSRYFCPFGIVNKLEVEKVFREKRINNFEVFTLSTTNKCKTVWVVDNGKFVLCEKCQ